MISLVSDESNLKLSSSENLWAVSSNEIDSWKHRKKDVNLNEQEVFFFPAKHPYKL